LCVKTEVVAHHVEAQSIAWTGAARDDIVRNEREGRRVLSLLRDDVLRGNGVRPALHAAC